METLKDSDMSLGNLPLEIMTYIGAFLDYMVENGQLKVPMQQTVACELDWESHLTWSDVTDSTVTPR
jgi:hypothetical protein